MRRDRVFGGLLGYALLSVLLAGVTAFAAPGTAHGSGTGDGATRRILVLGDSLSAEYGLPRGTGWVTHVEQRLKQRNQAYQIRNASISGDTTIGGLQRLPQLLQEFSADIVILQLGANDGLRGLPVQEMRANLQKMIELSRAQGAEVLLLGQHVPPNYGPRYSREFHEAFVTLAEDTGVALVPFMLEAIATDPDMFQPDGLHPTAPAQARIAETIWPQLEPLLR
ncbi:MAG TPA: arylesterase [Burkholderiaceae bacterium]|nr:arylesterase [Burkholderiaceae bacterium]